MTYQTCGEISCEECNDRYEKALARIAELEKQLLLAQTKVRTVDAALTARNGALEQMVREFLAEDVEAAGMSPTGNPCHNHRKGACEMTDSPFMTVSELKAKLEAERDTERELTATYAKYIAAIPALCRGEEVPCAMHVSQPIKELRARIAELEQMVLEWQPIELGGMPLSIKKRSPKPKQQEPKP